jgi:putative hydrolase of the HAD superfamily
MNNNIKNIIFDFGGVIIPIDPMAYVKGMIDLGCTDVAALHEKFVNEQIYTRFEKGQISPADFRGLLRSAVNRGISDEQLDRAWNMIIGEIPPHRVRFLDELKAKYRTFLLSNTNRIHYDYYQLQFRQSHRYSSLDELFEKAYYSFQIGLYKPDPAIFEFVLNDSGLAAGETIFIDDFISNTDAARKCGLHAIHLADGMEVTEIAGLV